MNSTFSTGHVCQHGSLARSCELCEKDAEIERLRESIRKARVHLEMDRADSAEDVLDTALRGKEANDE